MLKTKNILLASHDTPGARAAEKMALALCPKGGTIHHLVIVPDFWKGTIGDDWLNNASTRDTFATYLEAQLEDELRTHIRRLEKLVTRKKLRYRLTVLQGKPTDCLVSHLRKAKGLDLLVMGSPRPRGKTGLRSRIDLGPVTRATKLPILIVPNPGK